MIFNFRNWVLQTFPFLEDDFDALTDYELFCKMMEYVKQITKDNEDFNKRLTDLENYISNLDLQEEVNNKLDEMAKDGTLENLISQYIQLATTYVYNNVDEMKSATNLVNGSFARTSGFYSYNDGGGAYYKIRTITNEDIIDNIHLFSITNTDLIAELIAFNKIDVKQLGAKNNQDNKNIIQYALNTFNEIKIDEMYEVYSSLSIYHDNTIIYGNGGLFINHSKNSDLLDINTKNNITIKDISLTNDNIRNDSVVPDQYRLLFVSNSNNILIDNIKVYNAYNLGCEFEKSHFITIRNSSFKNCYYNMVTMLEETSDILVENCIFDTVTTTYINAYLFSTGAYNYSLNASYLCKNLTVQNNKFYNNPIWEGIDSHGCENVKIINNYIYNCKDGIVYFYDVRKSVTNILCDNIEITGNVILGNINNMEYGITVYGDKTHLLNNITIKNNTIKNYSKTINTAGIFVAYSKNINVFENIIKDFGYFGIMTREIVNGIISNNQIYNPTTQSSYGIHNIECTWFVNVFNNIIHGGNNSIARGINTGDTGCLLLGNNTIYNYNYRYASSSSSSTPLGIITSSLANRLGCKGVHGIDQNDIITSYCTDDVIRGDGSTLSEITITSNANTNTITLPENESILLKCTIGEEITIPGAGNNGNNLTVIITDIISERVFTISNTIKTAVTNVHPVKSSSSWTTI